MSSVYDMLGLQEGGFNIVLVIPVAAVLVAVNLLFKFSVRKPEINKKPLTDKKPKVTTNQKDGKHHSGKKVHSKQDKKTLPSSVKDLEACSDIINTKTNKKQSANEQSPKKGYAAKKQQVGLKPTENSSTKIKKLEKSPKSLINNDEEGEWQTVIKKKQKPSKPDEIVNKAIVVNKTKKSSEKPKKIIDNIQTNLVKKDEEANSFASIELVQSEPRIETQATNCANFTDKKPVPNAYVSNNETEFTEDNALKEKNNLTANVAFDELGDDVWTNSKPQKKNRKKALRE